MVCVGVLPTPVSLPICVVDSYSVSGRGRFGVFVESEDSTMEDGPGLTPVLPVQHMKRQSGGTAETKNMRMFFSSNIKSHLIFFPLSATLVLLMIPAFSSRWPCRDRAGLRFHFSTTILPFMSTETRLLCKYGSGVCVCIQANFS